MIEGSKYFFIIMLIIIPSYGYALSDKFHHTEDNGQIIKDMEQELSAFAPPNVELANETLDTIDHIIPAITPEKPPLHEENLSIKHGKSFESIDGDIKTNNKDSKTNDSTNITKDKHGEGDYAIHKSDKLDLSIEDNAEQDAHDLERADVEEAFKALKMGLIESATMLFERAIKEYPNDEYALFALATIYHNSGELEAARALYTKVLTINPGNYQALNNFLALVGEEAPEEAILELKKLEAVNPNMGLIPAQIAMIYIKQKNITKAMKYLNKAILLSPSELTYRYNLAILLDQSGDKKAASTIYRQLIREWQNGKTIPENPDKINQRLNYLSAK